MALASAFASGSSGTREADERADESGTGARLALARGAEAEAEAAIAAVTAEEEETEAETEAEAMEAARVGARTRGSGLVGGREVAVGTEGSGLPGGSETARDAEEEPGGGGEAALTGIRVTWRGVESADSDRDSGSRSLSRSPRGEYLAASWAKKLAFESAVLGSD